MRKQIDVLQVVSCMEPGGIQIFLMNVLRNIDRNKIKFTFLIHQEEKGLYEDEIEKLGCKIHRIKGIRELGHFGYNKELDNFFNKNKFDIVHSHYNQISSSILKSAKKNGMEVRVAHSHTAYPNLGILGKVYTEYSKRVLNFVSTDKFACGQEAGAWLYGKKSDFISINNGIDLEDFKFDSTLRKHKRKELGIKEDELLIGHVGRFSRVKNHKFIIEIFNEIQKEKKNVKLILIGDGELKKEIQEQISKLGVKEKVILLGIRKDVKELLNIFDAVIFPSLYEGLPVTLIENQANDLKSYISNTVNRGVDMGCGMIEFLSLEKSAKEWAEYIVKDISLRENADNKKIKEALQNKGYDITETANWLEQFYCEKHKEVN